MHVLDAPGLLRSQVEVSPQQIQLGVRAKVRTRNTPQVLLPLC